MDVVVTAGQDEAGQFTAVLEAGEHFRMNWFKRSMLVGALAAATSFMGCQPPAQPAARASGSLALSSDDSTVFAVDTDNGVLAVINPKTEDVQQVKVGRAPVRVIVDANDTAFVTNRGDRSVSVVRKGERSESARVPVGVEPSGMALTPDGKTLLVVSATALDRPDHGLLTAIDTQTLEKKWEIPVGEEPRAVAVIAGDRALVTLYRQGELVEVDLAKGQVTSQKTGIYETANASRLSPGTPGSLAGSSSFRPRAMADLVVTPEGDRVFAPVVWAREDAIARPPSTFGGYYSSGGPCNIGAVATAGIVTVDTGGTPQPQVDDLTSCFSVGTNSADKDFPASTLASSAPGAKAIQGPTVGVVDPTGQWLLVLSRESRNLAFMPAWKRSGTSIDFSSTGSTIRTVTDVRGHGADGLAVTRDFKRAYVYSQFDHTLEIFEGAGSGEATTILPKGTIRVANEALTDAALIEGRKLFFDAKDPRLSAANTTVACSTCHLEGREDGHVWQFPDGPRQTPALAGRHLLATAPYHWSGEFASLDLFNVHTITERMGGSGLDTGTAAKLDRFIDELPAAENPLRADMANGPAEARGKAAFEKAQCGTCHAGALFTDNTNADVGTLRTRGPNPDDGIVTRLGFNVPSLLGIGRSAPYLHDGSQLTLEERVFANTGDKHGATSALTLEEKTDLVAYLKSL
jgi:YVTN family beta-propeller protein